MLTTACAALSWAQVQYTTIQDVMEGGSGQPLSGTLTVQWQAFSTATGVVPAGRKTVALQDGLFTLTLAATDTAVNAYYNVSVIHAGITDTFTWQVPTKSGIARLSDLTIGISGAAPLPQGVPISYTATGTFASYSAGSVTASAGGTQILGQGTAWTQPMAGWWLQLTGTFTLYKVQSVDDQGQVLTTYNPIEVDLSAGGTYTLTQSLSVPQSVHQLPGQYLDATCQSSNGESQAPNIASTLVQSNGDVEVIFYTGWTGRCTLRR